MIRARGVAISAALVASATAGTVRAQQQGGTVAPTAVAALPVPENGVTFRLRSVHGLTLEKVGDNPQSREVWYGITPEVIALHIERRWQVRASYAITGGLHEVLPDELAHAGALAISGELSRRTTASLGGTVGYSTVSNFLLASPANVTPVGAVPLSRSHYFTVGASQGLGYEVSRRVRFDQRIDGNYVAFEQPTGTVRSVVSGLTLGIEHAWRNDALGVETRGAISASDGATVLVNRVPINIDQVLVPIYVGPRWRHDWSRFVSSVVTAGATGIFSPEKGTDPAYAPAGRATLSYDWQTAHIDASYSYGYEPNLLTAQMLRAHNASISGTMPLWAAEHVIGNATVGYLNGDFVNLRPEIPAGTGFDAIRADLEVLWGLRRNFQVLARYQFVRQSSDAVSGLDTSLTRHAFLAGIQISTAASTLVGGITRSPQRVDRSDGGY